MELRHLRAFIAVAEEMHFGRAASRLNLSPPPVSLAIKELEDELGLRLFERNSRRIALTPGGQELLRDARNIVARTEAMRQHAATAASGLSGSLSVGFISTATYSFLPELMRRFSSDHPDVRLSLHEDSTDRILEDLEAGALDLGLMFASPVSYPSLDYVATNRFELVAALPASHALAKRARVPLEKLADDRFLLFERQQGALMFDKVVAACMQHGFSPRLFHARQQHTIVSLVSSGFGLALVPDCVQVIQREGVVYRRLRGEAPVVEVGAAWRRDDDSPTLKAFLQYVPQLRR
ncbi:LysR family transcriptional regulator [Xylophilus rhododendri]|uniref:LysR family transcriptional regulator n=1 Tax=Xylophilus rhododendri TaxID=2697032 RepID=A0A857J1A2_9BURK|nr:LysR family transcriptional regulator [Xylophilus rhododendri]QHI97660.1 LysR family transcriptional regulator [Xylophilus rhododendri]